MSSYRKQINAAVKAQLSDKTIAGLSVFTTLDRPLDPERDLPAVLVYTMEARRGDEDYGNSVIPRIISVVIEAAVSSSPELAMDAANDLAEQIELAMEADTTLGLLVQECRWVRSNADVTSHGSTVMGVCILEYSVSILTNAKEDTFGNDPFTVPPHLVIANPNPSPPDYSDPLKPNGETACGPDGCDIPAWGGELEQ